MFDFFFHDSQRNIANVIRRVCGYHNSTPISKNRSHILRDNQDSFYPELDLIGKIEISF